MSTTTKIRKSDIASATDLTWIDGLNLDQQSDELYAEMNRVVEIEPMTAYGETVRGLRLAAISERFELIAAERNSRPA